MFVIPAIVPRGFEKLLSCGRSVTALIKLRELDVWPVDGSEMARLHGQTREALNPVQESGRGSIVYVSFAARISSAPPSTVVFAIAQALDQTPQRVIEMVYRCWKQASDQ
jgi:hypothetical protein